MSQSSGLQRAIGVVSAAAVCAVALAVPAAQQTPIKKSYPLVRDQRGVIPPGPKVPPYNSPPLGDGPWQFDTYEQRNIRVSVVAKGLSHPWSVAFLPGGDMLITERIGRLRVVRNGVLDPAPVARLPQIQAQGLAGFTFVVIRGPWKLVRLSSPMPHKVYRRIHKSAT